MQPLFADQRQNWHIVVSYAWLILRLSTLYLFEVGTESISPLYWAIETGSIQVAKAVFRRVPTIRCFFSSLGPCACLKAFHVAPVLFRTMLMMLMDEIKHILVTNHLISFECFWFIWVRCISNLLKAMIIDLLTIRADRDNYYYGCLFEFPGSGALEGCGSVELVRMCNANHVSWSRIVVNFASFCICIICTNLHHRMTNLLSPSLCLCAGCAHFIVLCHTTSAQAMKRCSRVILISSRSFVIWLARATVLAEFSQ